MGIWDRAFGIDKIVESKVKAQTAAQTKKLGKQITDHIDKQLSKASSPPTGGTVGDRVGNAAVGVRRYAINSIDNSRDLYSRKKPGSLVPFDSLRKFSIQHEVSRIVINYRKRQIASLEWDIVTAETDDVKNYDADIAKAKEFFKNIGGRGNKYRKFINKMIEDLLVIDAVALYKQPTVGGKLYQIVPVDATTIRLRMADDGSTPEPPEVAYKQVIRGSVVETFTADEMIYDMLNPRSDSPYGLAPLESLMIVVSSSLKAALANLGFLTEGNIPEGFFGVPKEWTPQMISDFQENWDAVMAGDEAATAKLKFVPEGSYQPAKKMTDMAWEGFNEWLAKVTCAMFDVRPSEVGLIASKGGLGDKGSNEVQADAGKEFGLVPMAHFIEEIFTDILQNDLGMPQLKFSYSGLEQKDDAMVLAQVREIQIRSGQRTINELRTDDGLDPDPSPQADQLMISTGAPTFLQTQEQIDENKQIAQNISQGKGASGDGKPSPENPTVKPGGDEATAEDDTATNTDKMVALVAEFRKFRKMAVARKKAGKVYRPFESKILPEATIKEMNQQIEKAADAEEVKKVFGEFMQDYQIEFLADVIELDSNLKKVLR